MPGKGGHAMLQRLISPPLSNGDGKQQISRVLCLSADKPLLCVWV